MEKQGALFKLSRETRELELKKELESVLYSWGKSLIGDEYAGKVMGTLIKRRGLRGTHLVLKDAARSLDPREFVGGVLKKITDQINDGVEVGTKMGNYEWDGGKWRQIEGAGQPSGNRTQS